MPITQSAIKKLRQDKKKTAVNQVYRRRLKTAIKTAKAKKTAAAVRLAYRALDRAAKHKVIHKNKAGRLRSQLMRLVKK